VISWKSPSITGTASTPEERLFVSSKAALDGTKAVRGGIPVVFPIFGPPVKEEHNKLSQHGFARSETWTLENTVMDNEAGVSVKLSLTPSSAIHEKFPYDCKLEYIVTLAEHQLTSDLHVVNTGSTKLTFQALLHTYFLVPSAPSARVTPLHGLTYTNKTKSGTPRETEERQAVDVMQFTDSVYEAAGGKYEIAVEEGGRSVIGIKTIGFGDVVIWNPGKENGSKMGDMEDGGWDKFICVEPGAVSSFVELNGGDKWTGQQVLSAL